eukprot:s7285_g1.t1
MVAAKHTRGGNPDIVLLSFFDGLGTACLCDEYCKGQGLRWKGASWEIDGNLVKLIAQHFPDVVARGDFAKESATSLHDLVQTLDPGGKTIVVVAAGPPCHDFSRIRSDAPGHDGAEGSKFSRFAQLVVDLEKRWQHGRAVLLVENVIPQNRADMRKIEKMLDAPAILHDAADFGTISRPRVWWCRVPWQEIAHRTECPLKLRWTTMQGIPRAHFDVVKDDPLSFDTGGLALPRCLTEEQKPLPCLTTPSDDPQGRPAPRSSKGKISSEANQRWRADRQSFAPWHYEAGVMMTDSAARLIFIMAMFAATPPTSARELNPIGGTALDIAANLWQGRPPLLGPGPGDYDEFDLSHLRDPSEHWFRSRSMPHPDHRDAQMEPGLQQWLSIWSRMRPHLADLFRSRSMPHPDHRDAQMEPGLQQWLSIWSRMRPHLADLRVEIVQQVEQLAIDMEDETRAWYETLAPHVRKAYASKPWPDSRYSNPLDMDDFLVKNHRYVIDKLRRTFLYSSFMAFMAKAIRAADIARANLRSFANATVAADDSPPYHDVNSYIQLVKATKKEQPPDSTQTIQGVTIAVTDKEVTVQGTEDRRRRLDEALVDVLTQDRLRPHEAASLAGKLQFYSQAITGRSHAAALRPLFRRAQLAGAGRDNQDWRLNSQQAVPYPENATSEAHASPKSFPFEQEPHSVLYADAFFNLFEKDWRPSAEDFPQLCVVAAEDLKRIEDDAMQWVQRGATVLGGLESRALKLRAASTAPKCSTDCRVEVATSPESNVRTRGFQNFACEQEAEPSVRYWFHRKSFFEYVSVAPFPCSCAVSARVCENVFLQMWRPGLNYPQTNKLIFQSRGVKETTLMKKHDFVARRTGRRLFLKLRRRARYVHQHFRSKPANLTLNREDVWMVLHDLTTHDGRAWNMQRGLGSARWHDDHVYALYKLAANLEEPFRLTARIPHAFVFLKKKKDYQAARSIISYRLSMLAPALKVASLVLCEVTKEVFPETFARLSLSRLWPSLHGYLREVVIPWRDVTEFEVVCDDLVGFFNSLPVERIQKAVELVFLQYFQNRACNHPDAFMFTVHDRQKFSEGRVLRGKARVFRSAVMRQISAGDVKQLVALSFLFAKFTIMGRCFRQIQGSPIGNQISPALCDLTVSVEEAMWAASFDVAKTSWKAMCWFGRYVDNRFLVFPRGFLQSHAFQSLVSPMFYRDPVVLEACDAGELLGCMVDIEAGTVEFRIPNESWQYRPVNGQQRRISEVGRFSIAVMPH